MMRSICIAVLLTAPWPNLARGLGPECVDYSNSMHWAAQLSIPYAGAVAVSSTTVYVSAGHSIHVVDVGDPTNPRIVSVFAADFEVFDMATLGPILFVVGGRGLQILSAQRPESLSLLARVEMPTFASGVAVGGRFVFVACGSGGVVAFDLSDIPHPRIAGQANTPGFSTHVATQGTIAYIAEYDQGVTIVDFKDPTVPAYLAFLPGSEPVNECTVWLNSLLVARGGRVERYDVTDPTRPRKVAATALLSVGLGAVASDDGLVLAGGPRLFALDVRSQEEPRVVGSVGLPYGVHDIAVQGDYAYVANGLGLQVVRVRPTETPQPFAHLPGMSAGLAAEGNLTYVLLGGDLAIYDVADPVAPDLLGSVRLGITPQAIALARGVAFVAGSSYEHGLWSGLSILDVSNPRRPTVRSPWGGPGTVVDVAAEDSLAFVANGVDILGSMHPWYGLSILDASNPSAPREVGRIPTTSPTQLVEARDGFAYLATGESLLVVDVSDPAAPRRVGGEQIRRPGLGAPNAMWLDSELAYVTLGDDGLAVVDVSTKEAPLVVGRAAVATPARGVAVHDGIAYAAQVDGLEVFDVLDPRSPRRIGLAQIARPGPGLSRPTGVAVANGVVMVSLGLYDDHAVELFPAQCTRTTPVVLASLEASRDLAGVRIRAHLGEDVDAITLLRAEASDLSDASVAHEEGLTGAGAWEYVDRTARPDLSYAYALELEVRGARTRSSPVFVPASGLRALRLELVSRNPSFGPALLRFELPAPAPARIDVYDVTGRLLQTLCSGPASAGSHRIAWDGRDRTGAPVAAGIYLVRLQSAGATATVRLARTR